MQPEPREPSGERVQPPAVGEFGHRMVAADGRHRPFVAVAERRRLVSVESASNLVSNVPATLDCRLSHLRKRAAIIGRRLRDIAYGEHLWMAVKGQVGSNRDSAAPTQLHPQQRRDRTRRDAGGPHDRAGLDPAAIAKHDRPVLQVIDADADLHMDAAVDQGAPRPFRQQRMKRPEQMNSRVDDCDRHAGKVPMGEILLQNTVEELAEATRHFHAGGTPADNDDPESVDRVIRTRRLHEAQQVISKSKCIRQRLQRKRVLGYPGHTECRADGTCGDHQIVVRDDRTVTEGELLISEGNAGHAAQAKRCVLLPADHGADRETDVTSVESRGGNLVEQRLERVEIVCVDERHLHIGTLQPSSGAQPPEPGADNDHVGHAHAHQYSSSPLTRKAHSGRTTCYEHHVEERIEPAVLAAGALVVLIGAAGSGKSTWARANFAESEVVSTDAMRALVGEDEGDQRANRDMFAIFDSVVEARVKRHLTTVIDSTALETERRAHYVQLGQRFGVPVTAIVFRATAETCLVRNAQRERRVPQDVIRAHVAAVRALTPDALRADGFADIIEIAVERATPRRTVRVVSPAFVSDIRDRRPVRELRVDLAISRFSWPGGAATIGQRLAEIAGEAEEVGVGGIWLMDHYRQIPQVGAAWDDLLELISTLGFLAAVTSRVRLGSLVASVSARSMQQLARSMATLDVLSDGRMICGLGAGWFEAEATEIGVRFPPIGERFELLEDALRALPLFWGSGGPSFEGHHLHVPKAMAYPRPRQDPLPLLVGGSGRRTLLLAAQYANAVNMQGSLGSVGGHVAYLHDCIASVPGRSVDDVEVTHLGPMLMGDDDADLAALVARSRGRVGDQRYRASVNAGTVQDQARRLTSLASVGVRTAIVSPVDLGQPGVLRRLGHLIETLGERSAVDA